MKDSIRRFIRENEDYFRLNQNNNQKHNYEGLKNGCAVYAIILVVYTLYTILFTDSHMLSIMYIAFDIVHLGLCWVVFRNRRALAGDYRVSQICLGVFTFTILLFFLLEGVFPYPDKQNIYVPFPLLLIATVFLIDFRWITITIFGYMGSFILLVLLFKDPAVQGADISVALATLIAAVTGYVVISKIRFRNMAAVERLRQFSSIDQLTGLFNKESFERLVNEYLSTNLGEKGYAMLFLDINKFKLINERFGHQVGDSVLKNVSKELRLAFYEKDLICRFGGDEFLIFMKDIENEETVKDRIRELNQHFAALSRSLKTGELSCSIGYAMKGSNNEKYSGLVARADAALYSARKAGGQQISFEEQHFREAAFQNTDARLESAKTAEASGPEIKKRRLVMVADDNRLNRQLLTNILSPEYEVIQAENGVDALEKLSEVYSYISAVLLDLMMPEMDGYTVLERMHSSHLFSSIPVIVTTGSMEYASEEKALTLGANDYILKPYQPAIIMHRLRNTINLRETAALANSAEKDQLTGTYTKEIFYQKAAEMLESSPAGTYDIVVSDIERFRMINELYGERTGDELLAYLAEFHNKSGGLGEKLMGRLGADNFVGIFPHKAMRSNSDFEPLEQYINKFPISLDLKIRFGIYIVDDLSVPISTICDRAIVACDSVRGKYGTFFAYYDKTFTQQNLSEQFILDNMENGLRERQFHVYYQPKIKLSTGKVGGMEALVRWIHPRKGFMSPGEFIPLFERNGFISDMDFYVWDQVCRDLNDWLSRGKEIVPVSVNVSRADIYNPNLPDILEGLIKQYRLKVEYLHLEITETAYTQNSEQLISTVEKLRSMGFIIEMDDFGSGYSSLNMLAKLPINILKLDMAFVRENASENNSDIMKAIAYLGRLLKMPIVAEGVETTEQVENLKNVGVEYVQGYLFAKPMPKEDLEKYLAWSAK